jgi:hypothetical protein
VSSNGNPERLYGRLKPPERLTLLLEAMARDDAAEAQRLNGSCPRRSYTGPDHRFGGRLDMAFDIVAVVTIDLRCMWGKLHILHWVTGDVVPQLATALHVTAGLGFVDGEFCGRGRRQVEFFAKPLPEPREEPEDGAGDSHGGGGDEGDGGDDEPFDEDDEEDEEQGPPKRHEDRGRRLAAVEKRAEHFTACSVLALTLAARDVAQDLVDTWEAFGRFCRTRVGVSPETMLRAWGFPVAGDLSEMLERYAHLKPDPQKVDEYTHYICKHWDERFGRRPHAADDNGSEGDDDAEEGG